jgi:isoleucyl-tRNA synthetase
MFKPVSPKVDFVKIERKRLSAWYKNGIIKKYLEKNRNSKNKFSFIDGPITANNPMAVHHAWGRTYKDLWQRFFNMRGFKQRFQNGFDEQGLWVEVKILRIWFLGKSSRASPNSLISARKESKSTPRFKRSRVSALGISWTGTIPTTPLVMKTTTQFGII